MLCLVLRHLKRRRVLRTATMYVLGAWIALQVVEVLADAGLPASTMRHLLVVLSLGFPFALVVGWYFDISSEGIVKTRPLAEDEKLPELKFIDHVMLAGLITVVSIDIYVLSLPAPDESLDPITHTEQQHTIAVLAFDDVDLGAGTDPIGYAVADELRSSLTRTAGLRVLGPETSKMLHAAGENAHVMAKELFVSAILLGDVMRDGGRIRIHARLVGIPAANEIWSTTVEAPLGDALQMQDGLIRQIIGAAAPALNPDPVQGPRAAAGDCSNVYEIYLRGKQLIRDAARQSDQRRRGLELLHEAVAIDDQCAIAWEAIAVASVNWTLPGFTKAGAAARRALELNDSLPEAWWVLAELAEEEERWSDAEEYFLRALLADPTNARANEFYAESLYTRGRIKDGLRYMLEAYRYDPASLIVNWHTSMAAKYAGEAELTLKHAEIMVEIRGDTNDFILDLLAEGYLLRGDKELAIATYLKMEKPAPWFIECVRLPQGADAPVDLIEAVRATFDQRKAGTLSDYQELWWSWQAIRCGTWIGESDIILDLLTTEVETTEQIYFPLFLPDAVNLRQHPRFRQLVDESGLLEYWRQWGWSDYCRPDGDSFRCD